jgi:hypothetical protein
MMSHSTKREHHELSRKRHRHEQQKHARELAKKKPSTIPRWLLAIGITCIIVFILVVTLR